MPIWTKRRSHMASLLLINSPEHVFSNSACGCQYGNNQSTFGTSNRVFFDCFTPPPSTVEAARCPTG